VGMGKGSLGRDDTCHSLTAHVFPQTDPRMGQGIIGSPSPFGHPSKKGAGPSWIKFTDAVGRGKGLPCATTGADKALENRGRRVSDYPNARRGAACLLSSVSSNTKGSTEQPARVVQPLEKKK
jgi:hypothetical protein